MFNRDVFSRRIFSVLLLVVVGVTVFLLSRNSTSEKSASTFTAGAKASALVSSSQAATEAISPAAVSINNTTAGAAGRPVYRFETPVVAGKPAAIPARFSTPSAAEATIRSARLAELIDGSLSSLRQGDTIQLPLPDNRVVSARINVVQREADGQVLVGGELTGNANGSFSLGEDDSRLGGVIIPADGKLAYQIETGRDGAAYLLEKNKSSVVCMELPVLVVSRAVVREAQRGDIAESSVVPGSPVIAEAPSAEYLLSSRPTATAIAYLDFDGETVVDSNWNGGGTINASSSGLTADQITEVWRRVSEDFRPFNIDVTTNRSRYDNAPAGSRMRCIITQSSTWYVNVAGGVAYIGSWASAGSGGMSTTIPCWVFANNLATNAKYVAEAASHEIGHTLGLSHDGSNGSSGPVGYYTGHGVGAVSWAPIMGSGYNVNLVQWSNGNYSYNGRTGNNTENDLAIISDTNNHAGYMTDDAGDTRGAASALRFSSGSTVSTIGIIERTGDIDMYSFSTAGGSVTFTLVPEFSTLTNQPNLNARATIYDASGNTVTYADPVGSLFPTISTTLSAGTYYIAITGVGEGAVPGDGFTNYGSLGRYEITGSLVASATQPPAITSSSSGSAVIGSSYSFQVSASNSPTSYGASGLPSGLSINTGSGLISGTVSGGASAGVYSVTLTATNAGGSGTQTFSLTLTNPVPAAPSISSASTGSVVRGGSFSHQIVASNSPTSYNATGLPTGLSINTSTGLISGTVSTSVSAAVYSITLTATNAGGSGTQTFSLTVSNPLPSAPVISSTASGSVVRGNSFSHQITASNSPTSYNATGLPTGLSINTSTGLISGTVSTSVSAGVYPIALTATNAGGSGTQTFSLTVSNPLPSAPVISSTNNGSAVRGSSFSHQITATNSPTSYNATGLPTGLSINTSTGLISGTVSTSVSAAVYSIALTATNAGGSGTQTFSLTVSNPLPSAPVISSASSGSVVRGNSFSHQITASNSPTSYNATGLPTGLSINTSSGLISGTVSTSVSASVYSITLTATNAGGSGTQTFSLTVSNPLPSAPAISSVSSGSVVRGNSFSHQITASNSPTSYNATGLPTGLSINTSSGLISGTVSTSVSPGTYSVALSATNAGGTGTQTFALTVSAPAPSAPVITSAASASVVRGATFNHQITATNSPTSHYATGLPSGLQFNMSSGFIYGTVSTSVAAGTYSITLSATNAGGTGTQTFTLTVTNPLPSAPVITSASTGSAVIGSAFSHQVAASNSPTSYAATGLPAGLSINSSTGLISGTVSSSATAGIRSVLIVATNAGGSGSQSFSLTLTNPIPSAPVISSAGTASVVRGSPFNYQIVASNSPTYYNATGLPAGLSINNSAGFIYGTVSSSVAAGNYSVTLLAQNAGGSATKTLVITVTVPAAAVPVITSEASSRVVLGTAFNFQVTATNTPTSYTASGLPPELVIDSSTGRISGTVAINVAPGLYAVTLTASNASGSGTQMFGLEVKSAYAAWAQDEHIGNADVVAAADPDGDGMGNLLEYAFDRSPSSAETSAVTEVSVVNVSGTRRMEITFVRPANRPDLIYTVEVSSNMQTWTAGHAYGATAANGSGLPTQEIERTSLGAAGERIRVRDVGGIGQRFIRVKVTTF